MNDYTPDESNIGVYLWFVLLFVINATWIGMDLWLRANNHEYLTTEFREGLQSGWGVALAAATGATFCAVLWHFFIQQN